MASINSIVFVHGLWGHPRKTWETEAVKVTSSNHETDSRPSSEVVQRRKSSFVGQIMKTTGFSKPQQNSVSTFSSTSTASTQPLQDKTLPSPVIETDRPKPNRLYWPQDLLPMDIPQAKVMTYGYDADVIGTLRGDHIKMNNFTTHSQDLLVKLQREITHEVR